MAWITYPRATLSVRLPLTGPHFGKTFQRFSTNGVLPLTFETLRAFGILTADDPVAGDLLTFAADRGHREFPCLSRDQNPGSCVPCVDFSPWLRERVRRQDVDGLGEYLWRVRRANPGLGGSGEQVRQQYEEVAKAVMGAPIAHFLRDGSDEAYLDLRVTLIILAAHETFSGFIMAGEAADYTAAVMAPHSLRLAAPGTLAERRNDFVQEMGRGMDYWACWAPLSVDALRSPVPPPDLGLSSLLRALRTLPIGARAHAVDALRHLCADLALPRSLASLSRHETRRRGLDVADATRQILQSGIVVPASDAASWIRNWTRRDVLGFLAQTGVRAPKSWSKERLAELALTECEPAVRERMLESGAVELAPAHAAAARRLCGYIEDVKETWRVWLGFGTGIQQ